MALQISPITIKVPRGILSKLINKAKQNSEEYLVK